MKKTIYLLLILLLVSCGSDKTASLSSDNSNEINTSSSKVTVQSILSTMERGRYKEGELLVKFKSGVTTSSLKAHQAVGAASLRKFSLVLNLEHVKLPEGISVKDAIIKYMNDPDVEYAEPNYIKRILMTPNDPLFSQQWGLQTINTPGAWDITTGSNSVIVAVLDTGIDYTHPDLAGNIWSNPGESCTDGIDHDGNGFINDCRGWDFTTCARFSTTTGICINPKSPDNNPMDDNGHGTHVSGIIGAVSNNATGIAGVMWNVQLMPLKILNADGDGTVADEIAAIQYAVAKSAKIINASFAGSDFSQSEYYTISSANSVGILMMAAAGNESVDNDFIPSYPASYGNPSDPNIIKLHLSALPNIISVTASYQTDGLATFSNYGLNSVHVAAPGVNILSTIPLNMPPCTFQPFNPNYDFCSGTSQATPHVSGLAGLLYSVYPNFTYSQIRGMIIKYVDALPLSQTPIFSNGRINAFKAVSSLLTPTNLSATAASSTQISLTWTGNATGAEGYKIERKTGSGSFGQIAALTVAGPGPMSFTDTTNLGDGTAYTYRVKAFTSSLPNPAGSPLGEAASSYSNEAPVTTPLSPPAGLTASNVTSNSVTITWTDNSQSEEGYKIERKTSGSDFVQITTLGPNTLTYTDSGLSASTTYSYRVRAFNTAAGNSSYSNELSVTTQSESGQGGGGGGGGCSIGMRQNTPTAIADSAVILTPLWIIALMKRRR